MGTVPEQGEEGLDAEGGADQCNLGGAGAGAGGEALTHSTG